MRVIAKIETKTDYAVKGRKLEGIRNIGDPSDLAKRYYEEGADEIFFIDSVASLYGRATLDKVVSKVSETVFSPMCVGGGIRTIDDCKIMFDSGADKVALNSILFKDIQILKKISKVYGSQSIVVEIQAKKNINGSGYSCLCEYGREYTGIDLIDWLSSLKEFQIGEVHIISVDHDGMNKGVDRNLIDLARINVNAPLVYSGGFNSDLDDIEWLKSRLEGLAIASGFHLGKNVASFSQRNN
ncbi:HisA/HisF-related TIM barrel protein [Gammaproteobacteria bacterium]|jgi:cyclase|nr:HisA/HisF-related TIM barrel protein [Gammaproteobacteria bacterium]MDB0028575.1 HisA/HisF-related TIM barrel protein [bacterium]MDB4183651.1 HisA/HisF-related TIM barrel protein [Gammaproteobacteria bacterium]